MKNKFFFEYDVNGHYSQIEITAESAFEAERLFWKWIKTHFPWASKYDVEFVMHEDVQTRKV